MLFGFFDAKTDRRSLMHDTPHQTILDLLEIDSCTDVILFSNWSLRIFSNCSFRYQFSYLKKQTNNKRTK